jgi:hypothetical protein
MRSAMAPLSRMASPHKALLLTSIFSHNFLRSRPSWHRKMILQMSDPHIHPDAVVISSAIAKAGTESQLLWVAGLAEIRLSTTYPQWYPVVIEGLIQSNLIAECGLLSVVSVIPAGSMDASLATLREMLDLTINQGHPLTTRQAVVDSFWDIHPDTVFEKMAGFLPRLREDQTAQDYIRTVMNLYISLGADSGTRH